MARLSASVGRGGVNRRGDVRYVQVLLSDWLLRKGDTELKCDGIAGDKTHQAISRFQREHTGVVDGRVDPQGRSIKALEALHRAGLRAELPSLGKAATLRFGADLNAALSIRLDQAYENYLSLLRLSTE
jgi:peptidoglycan hydrolase-like protein with peptidoglycan-binding domain